MTALDRRGCCWQGVQYEEQDFAAMTGWAYLGIAIVLEVIATTMLKLSDGLARWQWAAASILFYAICFLALAPALKTIPVGVAYAIWSGVGIIAISVLGVWLFGQKLTMVQVAFMAMIIVGAVGLRATSAG
jgi:multidrug transporter EmrE-like cation transporter